MYYNPKPVRLPKVHHTLFGPIGRKWLDLHGLEGRFKIAPTSEGDAAFSKPKEPAKPKTVGQRMQGGETASRIQQPKQESKKPSEQTKPEEDFSLEEYNDTRTPDEYLQNLEENNNRVEEDIENLEREMRGEDPYELDFNTELTPEELAEIEGRADDSTVELTPEEVASSAEELEQYILTKAYRWIIPADDYDTPEEYVKFVLDDMDADGMFRKLTDESFEQVARRLAKWLVEVWENRRDEGRQ